MFYSSEKRKSVYVNGTKEYRYRVLDISVSLLALLISAPVLLIIMLLIKISDIKAPVFFKQKRIGLDGVSFEMYKFRSMVVGAEKLKAALLERNEVEGLMFKINDDPRITRIGKVLRKTSLDEFPQLLNVLQGHMSIVGPRPPLPEEVEEYTSYDKLRLLVKPGCTGLWQVSGRNKLSFQEMVELDLYYIRHRSIRFNCLILMKTWRELTGKGSGV
ncbi:sugar transferase [Listeria booriae]|uniref:Sugar transferase n=1 Tax=Listeria booriae TaxID=1552123 RepID=A0A7X0Z2J8_9LIST|nr:sugar transferase [Listeria booriae]MBC1559498.1 sugar transferase [Listeria booriae]MBC1567015.1 sugar transferase [Listeria booriae]MBC2163927.1 sugar transferase [Listeria booriae]MBC2168055.1 sugar transferase [Listeria booriae]MBC2170362.1 sugar transferase [Listeria booriae]